MATSKKLIDLRFMTLRAILRGQGRSDDKALVIDLLLIVHRLMTVEARDARHSVSTLLVLGHNGRGLPTMAIGALASRFDKGAAWLIDVECWSLLI